ncbi:MAG: tetratricopeptide repeat protein [Thermomicrobiales bacterium]
MPEIMALVCPVCGAPLSPGATHCAFCGSAIYIKADAPQLNLENLNQAVIQEHIADFRARIRKDRYDVEAHYGLGMAYYSLGLTDEAIEELTHAAKLMPENADIQTQLAVVLHHAVLAGKKTAEQPMEERLAKALTLDPTNFEANLLRADVLQRRGEFDRALAVLQPVIPKDPVRGNAKRIEIIEAIGAQRSGIGDLPGLQWAIAQIAPFDEARARGLAIQFLRNHQELIPPTQTIRLDTTTPIAVKDPVIDSRLASKRSPAGWGKTILVAIGVLAAGFVIFLIAAGILAVGQDRIAGWRSAVLALVLIAWIGSPIVAILIYRRGKPPLIAPSHSPRVQRNKITISREDLLAGRASLDVLTASIERLVAHAPARPAATSGSPRTSPPASHPALPEKKQGTSAGPKAKGHWFDSNR